MEIYKTFLLSIFLGSLIAGFYSPINEIETSLIAMKSGEENSDNLGFQEGSIYSKQTVLSFGFQSHGDDSCAIIVNGSIHCGWLTPPHPNTGETYDFYVTLPENRYAVEISSYAATGARHTCALLDNGSVFCWGENNAGQVGAGAEAWISNGHVLDLGGAKAVEVSAGDTSSCAILENGSVVCWGSWWGAGHRLGPVHMELGSGVSAIALVSGTCALSDNHSIACWGNTETAGQPQYLDSFQGKIHAFSGNHLGLCAISSHPSYEPDVNSYHPLVGDVKYRVQCMGTDFQGSETESNFWSNPYETEFDEMGVIPIAISASLGQYKRVCLLFSNGEVYCKHPKEVTSCDNCWTGWYNYGEWYGFQRVLGIAGAQCFLLENKSVTCLGLTSAFECSGCASPYSPRVPMGTISVSDRDLDDDSVISIFDAFPLDSTEWSDIDGDGVGDNGDYDKDGDGVPNAIDHFPLDPNESVDTDGDGVGDNEDDDDDTCPVANGTDLGDTDNDVTTANNETARCGTYTGPGSNFNDFFPGDGVVDQHDFFPLNPAESVDTDGDGVGDNEDDDDDSDGVLDGVDLDPLDPCVGLDTDGDGYSDNLGIAMLNGSACPSYVIDDDDDDDGIKDHLDAFPLDETRFLPEEGGDYTTAILVGTICILIVALVFVVKRN